MGSTDRQTNKQTNKQTIPINILAIFSQVIKIGEIMHTVVSHKANKAELRA